MFFDDYRSHPDAILNPSLLWEYDINSPDWDWNRMATTVVRRVIELGLEDDYYALFNLYGSPNSIKQIIMQIPYLNPKDMEWVCVLFHLNKEQLLCYKRKLSRTKLLNS